MKLHVLVVAVLLLASCNEPSAPEFGNLKVSIATTGGDQDQDGYRVLVGSERIQPVATEGSVLIQDLPAGTHSVTVDGLAENCILSGSESRTVTITSGSIAEVSLEVQCEATGISIVTRTTGIDLPAAHPVEAAARSSFADVNGNLLVTRLRPGSYTVSITLPENCSVAGGNRVTVNVVNRALTVVAFDVTCLPTDKTFVFARDTVAAGGFFLTSILAAGPTGSSPRRLVEGSAPAWSVDGKKVIYSNVDCDYYYYGCSGGLAELDIESRVTRVLDNGALGTEPSWSRDGNFIAFIRVASSYGDISTLRVAPKNGSSSFDVPAQGHHAGNPTWSPDGRSIAFECRQGVLIMVCMVNSDGTGFARVTGETSHNADPAWSPDGARIAFETNRFSTSVIDIALMKPDGSDVVRLTSGFDPAWSPDGTKLVFARSDGLFTMNADGSAVTRITTGKHRAPAWRP